MKFIKRLLGLFSREPKSMQDYMAVVERHLRRVSKEAKKNPLPPSSDSVLRRKHQVGETIRSGQLEQAFLGAGRRDIDGNYFAVPINHGYHFGISLSQRQAFQILQKELPFPEAHVCDEALLAIIDDEEQLIKKIATESYREGNGEDGCIELWATRGSNQVIRDKLRPEWRGYQIDTQLNRYAASSGEDIPVVEVRKDELPVEKIVKAWDGDQDEHAPLDTSEVVVDKVKIIAVNASIETHISADPVCNYLMRYTNVMLGKSFDYVNAPLPGMSEETFATLQATSMQALPEVVRTLPLADVAPEVADAVRAERVRLVGVMYDSLTMMRK